MKNPVETLDVALWQPAPGTFAPSNCIEALEDGKVLYCPQLGFALADSELRFLDPAVLGDKAKSLAFDAPSGVLKHARGDHAEITAMMRRYSESARTLICSLLPRYAAMLQTGRTSFRPVGISGRTTSLRKDDTLLHVDAFPTSPVGDRRILRVFTNVNLNGETRHWRLGEPFCDVAHRFYPKLRRPLPWAAYLLKYAGLTRDFRTRYDQAMLGLHDAMKRAAHYQHTVPYKDFNFPPGSTWIVFTDAVSHAALSGQHLFEQTFYLPVSAMADQSKAPLRILEALAGRRLVPRAA
jgi:hypothetical protein